ncbi:MAG TPA: hypothetical protein DCR55_02825 [Lentisphaeria bacterium]|nr:hypothetical protein [Lentisphaeria bacterium]
MAGTKAADNIQRVVWANVRLAALRGAFQFSQPIRAYLDVAKDVVGCPKGFILSTEKQKDCLPSMWQQEILRCQAPLGLAVAGSW